MKMQKLTQEQAEKIAQWHYPGMYSFYDFCEDPEDLAELLSPEKRGENYFEVLAEEELIGFFCFDESDTGKEVEVGLGLAPNLTGQQKGALFLENILNFLRSYYPNETKILLDVAEFNLRAQKVYEKLGFVKIQQHLQETNGSHYPFVLMARPLG